MSTLAATGLVITNPLVKYRALLATKSIAPDPAQHRLALHLAKLYDRLKDYEPEVEYSQRLDQLSRSIKANSQPGTSAFPSTWRYLQSLKNQRESLALTRHLTSHESAMELDSPQGLMLHGEVGTGKSMLIDLFADCLPNRKKKRWHFNTFMLETFSKLEALRRSRALGGVNGNENDYSLLWLAKDMIQTSPILFLDEFQMPDRVASKILTNLMTSFFHLGGVLVATSNRMPEELAKAAGITFHPPPRPEGVLGWQFGLRRRGSAPADMGGYNEFAAFLDVLRARCEGWEMEGGKDYRRLESGSVAPPRPADEEQWRSDGHEDLQHSQGMAGWEAEDEATLPDVDESQQTVALPKHFAIAPSPPSIDLAQQKWTPALLTVYGRPLAVPRTRDGTSYWTFPELCAANLGPADYISLASTYHTLIVTDVPVLTGLMKNEARRFITLLDALYECRCKLAIHAAAGPDDLFFPDEQREKAAGADGEEGGSEESVYSETLSEVYQDATAPFRPNILSQNPNYAEPDSEPDYTHARLAGLLNAHQLEDDPPNKPAAAATTNPFGRSFGRTDAELMDRKPIDPDDVRSPAPATGGGGGGGGARPDFRRTSAFTGEDERFAYKRAQSRLWELCGARWWAHAGPEWHRPLPASVRRWEARDEDPASLLSGDRETTRRPASDIVMGDSIPDASRDERSFRRPATVQQASVEDVAARPAAETSKESPPSSSSPWRTSREPAPKFSWTHFWGTTKWGAKAGAWGQGPEGLKDRDTRKK